MTMLKSYVELVFNEVPTFVLMIVAIVLARTGYLSVTSARLSRSPGCILGLLMFVAWPERSDNPNTIAAGEILVRDVFRGMVVGLGAMGLVWHMTSPVTALLKSGPNCLTAIRRNITAPWTLLRRQTQTAGSRLFARRMPGPMLADEAAELKRQEDEAAARERQQSEHAHRNQLRFEVELLYDRHRKALKERLAPERFAQYFKDWLSPSVAMPVYEERIQQLMQMIRDLAGPNAGGLSKLCLSPEEIITNFKTRLQRLKYLDLDEDTLEVLELRFAEERDRQLQRYFREQIANEERQHPTGGDTATGSSPS